MIGQTLRESGAPRGEETKGLRVAHPWAGLSPSSGRLLLLRPLAIHQF